MGFFSSSKPQKGLTPSEYLHHRIYAKMRSVFPYSKRGESKLKAVNDALSVEVDEVHHHAPHLRRVVTEDDLTQKLDRLTNNKLISPEEAEKIREITKGDISN